MKILSFFGSFVRRFSKVIEKLDQQLTINEWFKELE